MCDDLKAEVSELQTLSEHFAVPKISTRMHDELQSFSEIWNAIVQPHFLSLQTINITCFYTDCAIWKATQQPESLRTHDQLKSINSPLDHNRAEKLRK